MKNMISKSQSSLTSVQGKNQVKNEANHILINASHIVLLCTMLISLFISLNSSAQHLYQSPKPLQKKVELEKIIGELGSKTPSRKLNILWVYGYDKHHISGAHDYVKVKDMMTGLLKKVPDVTVSVAFHFPTKEQFENTDLIVMYVHLPKLSAEQYENFQDYIKNGGGVVSLHETAIMRPAEEGKKLSECLGYAWNEGTSKWGAIFEDVRINNNHEIFKGFPEKIKISDEFYWDLFEKDGVEVLGTVHTGRTGNSKSPKSTVQLSDKKSTMFWTYGLGKGKVFGTTTGHHTFTYYDPEFRIILFRAMAWALNEDASPFMSLVFDGITDENDMVGTTELMRNWEGKHRE